MTVLNCKYFRISLFGILFLFLTLEVVELGRFVFIYIIHICIFICVNACPVSGAVLIFGHQSQPLQVMPSDRKF